MNPYILRLKNTKQKESGNTEEVKKHWSQVTSGHMREDESKPNNANGKNKLRLLCHDYCFGELINKFRVFLNTKNVEIGGIS